MSGVRFTSAFAADLEGYLAFKQNMGCYGASRIWYMQQFDTWCAEHSRAILIRAPSQAGWQPGWKARAGTGHGCPTSATWAGGCRPPAMTTPACCRTGGKPRSFPRAPTC
jgi:hypothetical protein